MKQKYIDAVLSFRKSIWLGLSDADKVAHLQNLADFYAQHLSINRVKIALVDFNNYQTMAKYNQDENVVELSMGLVCNGTIRLPNGEERDLPDAIGNVFLYLTHEMKHVEQNYILSNCFNAANERHVLLNCNQRCTGEINSYFTYNTECEAYKPIARMLYMLQPSEREAWAFAHKELSTFVQRMNEMFPDECSIVDTIAYSDFNRINLAASAYAHSQQPIKDVDNLLLTMNGYFVDEPLNQLLVAVVRETQTETMYNRLIEGEKLNLEKAKELNQTKIVDDAFVAQLFDREDR